jgi:hypothetical protein
MNAMILNFNELLRKATFFVGATMIFILNSYADSNLGLCLDGKFPSLCDKSRLTEKQRYIAIEAERKQNLITCMSGKYPSLCRYNFLSREEFAKVKDAEIKENYLTCKSGRYPSLCKHNLLTSNQADEVRRAEKSENLKTCMSGRYKSLCRYELLSAKELVNVQAQERIKKLDKQPLSSARGTSRRGDCESGHWIESVIDDGRIIKLEDGSVWEVDSIDQIDSMLWLPVSDIVVCGDKLINVDDNESVNATRLR